MNKHNALFLTCFAAVMFSACKKNNPGPPQVIVNPHEDIFYSRDTTDSKAYQMHITYNSNGTLDILRNEVGAVHASIPYEYILPGIQTFVKPDTARPMLVAGKAYFLIPFLPGAPAVSLASADTLLYTAGCTGLGGPSQLIVQTNTSPLPIIISVNPHGCASSSAIIKTHGGTYSFNGGSVLVQATALNIKK
jgi:hypothetical protein